MTRHEAEPGAGPHPLAEPLAGRFADSLAEHAALREAITRLERDARRLGALADRALRQTVARELGELSEHLRVHFAAELAVDGLYAELERDLPNRHRELAELKAEHRGLLRDVRALASDVGDEAAPLDPGGAAIRAVLRRLALHESRESQCLFDAVSGRDAGEAEL